MGTSSMLNPFLFIGRLSYLHCVQASLSLRTCKFSYANYTWISLQPPSCIVLWVTLALKTPQSIMGLKIITACRALLPSPSYSAGWSAWPSLQQAATPDPANLNFKKVRQTTITICSGLWYSQSTNRGRVETGGVYLPAQLERTPQHCTWW